MGLGSFLKRTWGAIFLQIHLYLEKLQVIETEHGTELGIDSNPNHEPLLMRVFPERSSLFFLFSLIVAPFPAGLLFRSYQVLVYRLVHQVERFQDVVLHVDVGDAPVDLAGLERFLVLHEDLKEVCRKPNGQFSFFPRWGI